VGTARSVTFSNRRGSQACLVAISTAGLRFALLEPRSQHAPGGLINDPETMFWLTGYWGTLALTPVEDRIFWEFPRTAIQKL